MRKYMLLLLLLLLGMGLYADKVIGPGYDFGILGAKTYNLDLRYSNELKRIYVIAEFNLSETELPLTSLHCFFMSRDVHLERMYINGNLCGTIFANNLIPEHFTPSFPYPALLDSTSTALCYTFNFKGVDVAKDGISYRMVYWLQAPEWQKDASGIEYLSLPVDSLWFPRNLARESTVNIELKTSAKYLLCLNGETTFTEDNGIRVHQGSFTDAPGSYSELKIVKQS